CTRCQPAHQASDRIMAQRLYEENLPAYPQHPINLAHRPTELEVMQNRDPEDHVETCIGEFQSMRVHLAEIAGKSQLRRVIASDIEFRLRNIDAYESFGLVAVLEEAPFP